MTKEQLIKNLITSGYLKNSLIIEAFQKIDRADFVRDEYQSEAYENYPLPIGSGQTISQPLTVAFMLELLEPKPGEKILDIGAGSGWQTALLAYVVSRPGHDDKTDNGKKGMVSAVERLPELCEFARKNIEKYGFISDGTVKFYCQNAADGELKDPPFDKIVAAAAASHEIPEEWKKELKIGGKIVAPIDNSIWLFQKLSADKWQNKEFPGFSFVPLIK